MKKVTITLTGYYIGCTNASNELSWQAAVRGIVKTYLTKFKGI